MNHIHVKINNGIAWEDAFGCLCRVSAHSPNTLYQISGNGDWINVLVPEATAESDIAFLKGVFQGDCFTVED